MILKEKKNKAGGEGNWIYQQENKAEQYLLSCFNSSTSYDQRTLGMFATRKHAVSMLAYVAKELWFYVFFKVQHISSIIFFDVFYLYTSCTFYYLCKLCLYDHFSSSSVSMNWLSCLVYDRPF